MSNFRKMHHRVLKDAYESYRDTMRWTLPTRNREDLKGYGLDPDNIERYFRMGGTHETLIQALEVVYG